MLDVSHTIIHKLVLRVVRQPDMPTDWDIMDLVWGALYDQFSEACGLSAGWGTFTGGGQFIAPDDSVKAQMAYAQPDEEHPIWALQIRQRDPNIVRRKWSYYIGLRRLNADSAKLYYAKCCYDHMAGSINEPKPIFISRDALPDPLFYSRHIRCMCGEQPLPVDALELNHATMPDFVGMLKDAGRAIPVILIACAWAIAPEILQDTLLGNTVVYWCDDSGVVMRLNELLPQEMSTPWNAVRVFNPLSGGKPYHPFYLCEDIRRMGEDAFVAGLRQAYCQSLRADDRRNFITINDVFRCRDRSHIDTLLAQSKSLNDELVKRKEMEAALSAENKALRDQLQSIAAQKEGSELAEYETLLNEIMAETDALKKGISAISTRLYSSMGIGFQPDDMEPSALLQELQHAIHSSLACANARK